MEQEGLSDEILAARFIESIDESGRMTPQSIRYSEEIYKRYYRMAFAFCRYYGLRHQDAEDTAQEVFIKIFRNIRSFKAGKPFRPWFLKITLNLIRDRYRNMKKNAYSSVDQFDEVPDGNEKNNSDRFQIRHDLQSILYKMPENLREVIILRIYQELDFEDIAAMTGVSSRQVRNRLEAALAYFKDILEAEND